MPARTLCVEGGWIVISTSVGEENETPFIRVWKPLPNRCVLKTLRVSLKGKAQRGQYLLAVGLGRYTTVLLFLNCGNINPVVCLFHVKIENF